MRVLVRLLRLLRPYRGRVATTALAAAGLVACSVTLPYLTRRVLDDVAVGGRRDLLVPLVLAGLAVGVLRFGLSWARRILAGSISLGVERDLRGIVFARLSRMSFADLDRMGVGQLMSRATSDLQTVRFFLGYGLIFAFMHAFTLALVAVLLLLIDVPLALVALAMGPLLAALAARATRRTSPVLVDAQQRIAELTQTAEESAVGMRVIKAFGRERDQTGRFALRGVAAFDRSMDANRLQSFYQPLMGLLPVLGMAAVLAYGGLVVIDGGITIGEFVQFYLYLAMLVAPFRSIGMLIGQAQRAIAGGTRIFEILDPEPEVREAPDALALPEGGGAVRLHGVRFAHGDGPPVLDGVDLDIAAGRSVALIGGTGSGKSTLVQLVPRFHDPQEGTVALDGVDVRRLRLDDLRRAVAMVGQEPFIFSTTIRENIAYGRPDADERQVREAARMAGADDFVDALPDGLDTVVGERGYTLSGGQRQRLAIARAILAGPRVLVLDEATASVDASTERRINRALRSVMAGRTTIVIAHRLSTIALADEIVVLDGGRVVARGTHEELHATSDRYREIHDRSLARAEAAGRVP